MERSLIKNLKLDEQNKLYGFVENIRNKKTMAFIVLRDVTGKVQVTVEKGKNQALDDVVVVTCEPQCVAEHVLALGIIDAEIVDGDRVVGS